jgi:hypothetical protein
VIRRLVVLLVLFLVAGCGGAQPAPVAAQTQTVRISYLGGQVSGDTGTVPVALGSQVILEVTTDADEEAHLHGYDKAAQIPAGGTATIAFTADIPGQFEFELHHSGAALAVLRVS